MPLVYILTSWCTSVSKSTYVVVYSERITSVHLKEGLPRIRYFLNFLGGWNSGSGRFSMMASERERRKIFIDSVIPFLLQYGFEGLDFDWEYPGDREGSDPEHGLA